MKKTSVSGEVEFSELYKRMFISELPLNFLSLKDLDIKLLSFFIVCIVSINITEKIIIIIIFEY